MGLKKRAKHKAVHLSSGQKQRLGIARALAKDTDIIIADEPTGNLDVENGAAVMKMLYELSKERLVIVVTHNFEQVQEYASRKIRLFDKDVLLIYVTNHESFAKEVFEVIFREDIDPEQYVEERGLKAVNDEGMIRKMIEEVIQTNHQSVVDYYAGKKKAMGFLVGQTMKAMKGKADPGMVNRILEEILNQ